MATEFSEAELEAYLEESLDPSRASEIEAALRSDKKLIARLSHINGRRDAGIHTLGEIWRQNQIGVPTSDEVAKYLSGELPEDLAQYIHFRLEVLKCRYTNALLADIERQQETGEFQAKKSRRERYLKSSAGMVKRRDD
ncbi:MAG: hypothetical protein R3C03_01225 [Pirellulaceae bacterium]